MKSVGLLKYMNAVEDSSPLGYCAIVTSQHGITFQKT
jgi:hypothetical protein